MNLTHRFSVPADLDRTWAAFSRLDVIAPCFPGAVVDQETDGEYRGFVKIKFGPVPLTYHGVAHYTERNRDAARMVIEARAAERRGHGDADATVTATFSSSGRITDVHVVTELAITGRPAQFGGGVIADVSDKLLDLFLNCLSEKLSGNAVDAELEAAPEIDGSDLEPDSDHVPSAATPGAPSGPDPEPRRAQPGYVYRPPSDDARPDFDVVKTITPVLLKRGWPFLVGGAVLGVLAVAVVRAARRR